MNRVRFAVILLRSCVLGGGIAFRPCPPRRRRHRRGRAGRPGRTDRPAVPPFCPRARPCFMPSSTTPASRPTTHRPRGRRLQPVLDGRHRPRLHAPVLGLSVRALPQQAGRTGRPEQPGRTCRYMGQIGFKYDDGSALPVTSQRRPWMEDWHFTVFGGGSAADRRRQPPARPTAASIPVSRSVSAGPRTRAVSRPRSSRSRDHLFQPGSLGDPALLNTVYADGNRLRFGTETG